MHLTRSTPLLGLLMNILKIYTFFFALAIEDTIVYEFKLWLFLHSHDVDNDTSSIIWVIWRYDILHVGIALILEAIHDLS
jgi:hypothetical protein